MAASHRFQIGLVSTDLEFLRILANFKQGPTDDIFMVHVDEAERTPERFDIAQSNIILVDWQVSVSADMPPDRLLNLVRAYARQGHRVAVVVSDDLFPARMVVDCMEAGACSLFIKTSDRVDLNQWLGRMLLLPMRGPWVQEVVFP